MKTSSQIFESVERKAVIFKARCRKRTLAFLTTAIPVIILICVLPFILPSAEKPVDNNNGYDGTNPQGAYTGSLNNGNYRVVNEVTSTVTTGAKEGTIIIEKPAAEALEKAKGEDILVFKIVFGEEYDDNGQLVSTMTFTIEKTHVDKEYTISGNKSGIETFECPNNTILFWLLWGEE